MQPSHRPRPLAARLVLGLLLLGPAIALALSPERSLHQYNLRTWRQSNGLPSNTVNTVLQTPEGHLWLGTPKGLVDFDGVEFLLVGLPGQSATRPPLITRLSPRSAAGFWVALERGNYGSFIDQRFQASALPAALGDYSSTRFVHETRNGDLFVGVYGSLWRIRPSGAAECLLPHTDIFCVEEDGRGRLWFGSATGELFRWEREQLDPVGEPAAGLWKDSVITAIASAPDGSLWIGAANGLHRLTPDLWPAPPVGIDVQPRALLFDRHGALWIGTISSGLLRYRGGAIDRLGVQEGLASDRILALAESDDGSLWIGTEDGLSQLADIKFPLVSRHEGLAAEACLAVATAPDGSLWAGTPNGLTHLRADGITNYGRDLADGFSSAWVKRLHVVRNGDVYFLGGRRDLNRFRDGRVTRTWQFATWPGILAEDEQGLLLSEGATLYRVVGDTVEPYRLADGTPPALGWINAVLRTRDGSLWVAAKNGLFQLRDGVLRTPLAHLRLEDDAFLFLAEDDDGSLWASRHSGLVRLRDGAVATVDRSHGLPSDFVYAFVADTLGHFWCDSPEGFFRIRQSELNAVADGRLARLTATLFAGQHAVKTTEKAARDYSGCRTADGQIWFPSTKGVIRIDPAHIAMDSRPPVAFIKRILVDGREYRADREPSPHPGAGNLEFNYAALDYLAPERIRYRYRLEGFQDDWVEAGARRTAFFTNLDPGRYRFRVQACNADGVWSATDTAVALTLPPRLDQTWWFRTGAGLLVAALLGYAAWTRERRRRRELAESRRREELQLQMIESSPIAMAMLDRHAEVLFTNATFTRLFGYTAREVPDLDTLFRRLRPSDTDPTLWRDTWRTQFADAGSLSPAAEPVEVVVTGKDGTRKTVAITLSTVAGRTLLVCTDLTARKRAEEERAALEEQLRQSQKMEAIGRLSGGVAHDFNNMLTAILGNVSLVETDSRLPPETAGSIADIKEAATRAANLTRQLLAFSRKQPIHAVPLDLNGVVGDMARMLGRILGEDIRMTFRLAEAPVPLHADVAMIEQVVLNLAVNARDAMPGGGELVIATAIVEIPAGAEAPGPTARSGRFARLTVGDSGNGIDPAILPRIFEPFFTTKDVGKGTGLGLATVYGIVEQHHGWIGVESRVGQGSTFHVHLPVYELEPAAKPPATLAPPPGARSAMRRTILVVEDDVTVRALARRALAAGGHEVLEAATGPEALGVWAAHRERIEILLTDIVMPDGLNGLELARRLGAEKAGLRVIYSSGYSADIAGGDFSGREGIDFLPKPYAPTDLLRIIERAGTTLPSK